MGTVAVSPAQAQCSPDPTVANGVTNCTSTNNDGLTVRTFSKRVIVARRSPVRGPGVWISVDALAGYAGGGLGLTGIGASCARLVGTAAGGIGYRLSSGLDLFTTASAQTGRDDHQETITTGVRLRF